MLFNTVNACTFGSTCNSQQSFSVHVRKIVLNITTPATYFICLNMESMWEQYIWTVIGIDPKWKKLSQKKISPKCVSKIGAFFRDMNLGKWNLDWIAHRNKLDSFVCNGNESYSQFEGTFPFRMMNIWQLTQSISINSLDTLLIKAAMARSFRMATKCISILETI